MKGEASQVRCLRKHPIHRCAVSLPQWGRLRNENTAIPETQPFLRGEGKEEAASPPKKESQPRLAALGSPFQGKGLAWTLPPSYGRRENAASQTSHEEGLRYENTAFLDTTPFPRGKAKRRRLRRPKRKPTPPRCARQPLPREGARVDTRSFLWKEVPRRGGGWMGMAV